ncbi:MAG TPA: GDYXXLXY domain-containing protein, partial [Burkholderiaceae bacterium]|nr:GDYXXLXY domain-containing protein [Burkholderiaceae bacterium]
AWLAAIPLLMVVGSLLGDLIVRSAGPYFVGMLLLAGAVVVLRSRDVPLFVEQLAIPALLVGAGTLGYGLSRDLGHHAAAAVLAVVSLGVGLVVRGAWLRVLLGAAAAWLFALAIVPKGAADNWGLGQLRWWWPWHGAVLVWLLAFAALRKAAATKMTLAAEALASGWLLATLAGLALWSGMTFLVGAGMGGGISGEIANEFTRRNLDTNPFAQQRVISAVLAGAAALWAARQWPGLRRPWLAGVGLVLVAVTWFMPTLGAVWLAISVCSTTSRWRLALAGAVAAAWIIGAFYYQLDWPLATKATVLAGAGVMLGVLAGWARAASQPPKRAASPEPHARGRFAHWSIVASMALVLAVANLGIWQKEQLIRDGQPIYVELAPVDPRSLMQGDFMRLNFRVPFDRPAETEKLLGARRPHVIARRDARGVAALLRIDNGTPLAADELRIELTPKGGGWILVSDAWYFSEGKAARWERAKYGEFRVGPDGRALLVDLKGPNLEAL